MEKEIQKRIMKQCDNKQKILIKLFPKTFEKVYHIGRIDAINYMLEGQSID